MFLSLLSASADAQIWIIPTTTTTTQAPETTTTVPASSTTTTTKPSGSTSSTTSTTTTMPLGPLDPGGDPTTTPTGPAPEPSGGPVPPGEVSAADASSAPAAGDGDALSPDSVAGDPGSGEDPAWAADAMRSVKRSPARSTRHLLELLAPLHGLGFSPQETALVGFGRFPVAGEANFVDDWWFPRYTPTFHLHQGTDVFAATGTPIRAPFDGVLTKGDGAVGGLHTYLTLPDRSYLYFAHLDRLPDTPDGATVRQGDVIGWVGSTGNARGGASHLHFEVHPKGGGATDPKPYLDAWLAEAEAAAPSVIARFANEGPRAVLTTRRTRGAAIGEFAAPASPLRDELLGISSMGAAGGSPVVAEAAVRAAAGVDWQRLAGRGFLRREAAARMRGVWTGTEGAG